MKNLPIRTGTHRRAWRNACRADLTTTGSTRWECPVSPSDMGKCWPAGLHYRWKHSEEVPGVSTFLTSRMRTCSRCAIKEKNMLGDPINAMGHEVATNTQTCPAGFRIGDSSCAYFTCGVPPDMMDMFDGSHKALLDFQSSWVPSNCGGCLPQRKHYLSYRC